ncbi:hypothetical protein BDY21DRAFT_290008 [Lineolata rhizophorae]|uniref:SET domain-containing protein n=1 Tax=Lineolata rhizophorae TaxID=578093 RepID=A0A6A6NUK6_9PEZI|nr:hypothetical protein BDY21DRAFT_290008 [Lineolata rhizophorae]
MTEITSLKPHADPQLSSVADLSPVSLANGVGEGGPHQPDGRPVAPPTEEEDSSTIKCICGYHDDDGNTVLCEKCNTWQHISCYYYPHLDVPDVHECADCDSRPGRLLDPQAATERQRGNREARNLAGDRKVKKPAAKNNKKRGKDSVPPQTNGWSLPERNGQYGPDRTASGSPRDQPPAKRPKTSHRPSSSIASLNQQSLPHTASKKKGAHGAHSPTKSPSTPNMNGYSFDYVSPEFVQLYRGPEMQHVEVNGFDSIGVAGSLSTWLQDPDELARATNGKKIHDLFQRVDRSIEELTTVNVTKHVEENTNIEVEGRHPTWQWLTVDSDAPSGTLIGELKGRIGYRDEYMDDQSNRWKMLRHPLPFVFFPSHLPIYIDTRSEGTDLRYVRRSCDPNVCLKVFIKDGKTYHFCLVAMRDIKADEEITLNWDTDSARDLLEAVKRNDATKKEELSNWVVNVLSNFGGCACDRLPPDICSMARFDRRNAQHPLDDLLPSNPPKSKKSRKNGAHISPLSTGRATNSRANSEAINRGDADDDAVDSRSASGSSKSKPASRDVTPMTHGSNDAVPITGLGVEMSDRERRKIMQQEKLFEQLEHDEQHGSKGRKKRNSAGSALNTPSANASVSLPLRSLGTTSSRLNRRMQKQLGLPNDSSTSATGHKSRASEAGFRSHNSSSGKRGTRRQQGGATSGYNSTPQPQVIKQPAPRPVYVDTETQTDPNPEFPPIQQVTQPHRKPRNSMMRRLLMRTQETKSRWESMVERGGCEGEVASAEQQVAKPEAKAVPDEVDKDAEMSGASSPRPKVEEKEQSAPPVTNVPAISEDVIMEDAVEEPKPVPVASEALPSSESAPAGSSDQTQTSPQPAQAPVPPWPPTSNGGSATTSVTTAAVPAFPTQELSTPGGGTATTPGSTSTGGSSITQSPSVTNAPAVFSPSVSSTVSPSPLKKKMSLSDYTKNRKKNEAAAALTAAHAANTTATSLNSSISGCQDKTSTDSPAGGLSAASAPGTGGDASVVPSDLEANPNPSGPCSEDKGTAENSGVMPATQSSPTASTSS